MAGKSVRVTPTVNTRRDLKKLERADLKKQLRKNLAKVIKPMSSAARDSARVRLGGHQLSQQIAAATRSSISLAGNQVKATVFVTARGDLSNLAKVVEGRKVWKHPTFGHDPEVIQKPMPFFYERLNAEKPKVEKAVKQAVKDLEKSL